MNSLYIGYSQQIGVALFQLHFGVLTTLTEFLPKISNTNKYHSHVGGLLNILYSLLQNTPYDKLSSGYLLTIYQILSSYLFKLKNNSKFILNIIKCFKVFFYCNYASELELPTKCSDLFEERYDVQKIFHLFIEYLNDENISFNIKVQILYLFSNYLENTNISLQNTEISKIFETEISDWFIFYLQHQNLIDVQKNFSEAFYNCLSNILNFFANYSNVFLLKLWKCFFPYLLDTLENENIPSFSQISIISLINNIENILCDISDSEFSSICDILLKKCKNSKASVKFVTLECLVKLLGKNEKKMKKELSVVTEIFSMVEKTIEPSKSHSMRIRGCSLCYDFITIMHDEFDNELFKDFLTHIFCSLEDTLLRKHPEKLQLSAIRTLGRLGEFAPTTLLSNLINSQSLLLRLLDILMNQLGFSHHVKVCIYFSIFNCLIKCFI